jgi:hypothetical protein
MKKTSIASVLLAMLFILVAGCATLDSAGHKYVMKGQVLDVSDSVAYLCIGSADGAKVGEEFLVYRYEKLPFAGPKQTTPSFKRETVGSVKITQIVDVHYATASILNGDIKVHDVAELGR